MARAVWNGVVLAESDDCQIVEGNIYFPPNSVNREFFSDSDHETRCPWKGMASYLNAAVEGENFKNAAWYYADPSSKAADIKDHLAFYAPVKVEG
ncbi:MAG: DUF427 domain-containing protein [Chloroflexi bacterium]|nr:DUF427 domain-containing protein [Chloroflexota bacterium]